MNIFGRNYEEEGHDIPMPESGPARFFSLLFYHFWKLIGVNILFVLFSIPLVTLPASLCAMNRVLVKLVRDGNVLLWQEFRDEFKADVFSAFLPGLLFSALLFGAYFFISLAFAFTADPIWCLIFWITGFILLLSGISIGEYYFIMKAELDLSGMALTKNAVLLSLASPGVSLLVFFIAAAALIVSIARLPVSMVLIFFLIPSLVQYTACFLINNVIQERIIGPYEQMQSINNKGE